MMTNLQSSAFVARTTQLLSSVARLRLLLVMLLTLTASTAWGADAEFAPTNFSGQGTSGTGSAISATVNGVTFTCDKGYGTTQFRCYSGSTITISSSNTITAISFTFSGSYTGGLATSYTNLNTNSWEKALSSQARITKCVVTYEEASTDPYTVTFHTTATKEEDIEEASAGAGVTPPTMEEECGEWTFLGWSESYSDSETSTTKLDLVTLDEGIYYPTADVDLYPVYTKSEGEGGTVTWNKVTTAPADWSGEYLIVNSNYAMTSDFNSGTSGEFKGASVTISNNQVTSSPSDKMIWIVEKNGSNAQYSFKNKSTGTYANITGTSSTNAALSSSVIWFTISYSSTSGVWKINSVSHSARCFAYYSANKSFRTYANSSNTTGNLYKKEGSGSTTYYYSYPQCATQTVVYLIPKNSDFWMAYLRRIFGLSSARVLPCRSFAYHSITNSHIKPPPTPILIKRHTFMYGVVTRW